MLFSFFASLNPEDVRSSLKCNLLPKMTLKGVTKAKTIVSLSQSEEKNKVFDLSSKIKVLKSVSNVTNLE